MNRYRSQIIAVALLLGLAGVVIPVLLTIQWARTYAATDKQAEMRSVAALVLKRSESTLKGVRIALHALADQQSHDGICSTEHIAHMRSLVTSTVGIQELGYFSNGRLTCTSWGTADRPLALSKGTFTTADGLGVSLNVQPLVNPSVPMVAFQFKHHNALVSQDSLANVEVSDDVAVLLTAHGKPIAALHQPDPFLTTQLDSLAQAGLTGKMVYAVEQQGEWRAVAMAPRSSLAAGFRHWLLLFAPAGLIVATLLVGAVVLFARKRLSPVGELMRAIRQSELVVYYQPIVDLRNGVCIGAEALVRWQPPDGKLIAPDRFIPLAERSGLVSTITNQVIRGVVRDLGNALAKTPSLHIAVNLAAADMQNDHVLDVLAHVLEGTGIQPAQIWLEATERGFMNHDAALATITRARARGHLVAIDDFGTGYSSLQYLQDLPLDALKIDKSFVDPITETIGANTVATHIIDLARSLGLSMIAEGIENEAQARRLKALGVNFGQGWLFSRPLPAPAFLDYLRENRHQFPTAAGTEAPPQALTDHTAEHLAPQKPVRSPGRG